MPAWQRTLLPHTALTEPASAAWRKINWPWRSETGQTRYADFRPMGLIVQSPMEVISFPTLARPGCTFRPLRSLARCWSTGLLLHSWGGSEGNPRIEILFKPAAFVCLANRLTGINIGGRPSLSTPRMGVSVCGTASLTR
ncbi:hypothetical protein [Nocardia sp. NPDC046763]|uniref:hypothetical protein n=1 Tax=Nocardia sp. NPDC046763 TaxID=3155256 RepID=UPI0033C44872